MKKTTPLTLDFFVGLFVLAGLVSIGTVILLLSGVRAADIAVTRITVKMQNADGVIKGTKVMMSGVRIGRVTTHPVLSADGRHAILQVAVQQPYQIRRGSNFVVRPEGILGDRFLDVVPPEDPNAPPLKDGDVAEGSRTSGLGDLADTAKDLVSDIKPLLANIKDSSRRLDAILTRLDQDVINEETAANLRHILSHLSETTQILNSTLTTAGDALRDAQEATTTAKSALEKFNRQLLDEKTLLELKNVITNLSRTTDSIHRVVEELKNGEGLLGRLAYDKQLADDFTGFVSSLRQRGILFYADVTRRERQEAAPSTSPQRSGKPAPREQFSDRKRRN